MKKIVMMILLCCCTLGNIAFAQEEHMRGVTSSIQMGLRLKDEAAKNPEAATEASIIIANVSGLIVDFVVTDFEKLKGYSLEEGIPCSVIDKLYTQMPDSYWTEFYEKKYKPFCMQKNISGSECQKYMGIIKRISRLDCRIQKNAIQMKGIPEPVEDILTRVTNDQPLRYKKGYFLSAYPFIEPLETQDEIR